MSPRSWLTAIASLQLSHKQATRVPNFITVVTVGLSISAACFLIKRAALGANESTHSEPSITGESHGNKTDDEDGEYQVTPVLSDNEPTENEKSTRKRRDSTARIRTKRMLAAQKRMDVLAEMREKQFERNGNAETGR